MSDNQIRIGTSLNRFEVSPRIMEFAQQLQVIHGNVNIVRESSGIHIYIASPNCLRLYGRDELYKMHLAINVDKYFQGDDLCAMCMKTDKPYRVRDLLTMSPVDSSSFGEGGSQISIHDRSEEYLVDDGNGNMILGSRKRRGGVFGIYGYLGIGSALKWLWWSMALSSAAC